MTDRTPNDDDEITPAMVIRLKAYRQRVRDLYSDVHVLQREFVKELPKSKRDEFNRLLDEVRHHMDMASRRFAGCLKTIE